MVMSTTCESSTKTLIALINSICCFISCHNLKTKTGDDSASIIEVRDAQVNYQHITRLARLLLDSHKEDTHSDDCDFEE